MDAALTTTDFSLPGQTAVYHGKVRDVYTINNNMLVAVATDRISAFDVILPRAIPHKGQILNQLAAYFLMATEDIIPNWLIETPDPNVAIGHKFEPFKVEMVVRGGLAGYAWRAYSSGQRTLCGVAMPDGMQPYDMFETPIITPSTKADAGHDEDISAEQIVDTGLATAEEFKIMSEAALELFERGQQMANKQGLILMDTKYEFGKDARGTIHLIDEIHTPDSSRYYYRDSYEAYLRDRSEAPANLSKEFVREWLMAHGFQGQDGQQVPEMDDAFVASVSQRYTELYEKLTGASFVPADTNDTAPRIEQSIISALKKL